jgi:hypothetical protein
MTTIRTRTAHRGGQHHGSRRTRAALVGCIALLTAAAGCSSSKRLEGAAASSTVAVTTTVAAPPTTDAPTTSNAALDSTTSTSESPTTTIPPTTVAAADPRLLRVDGIGAFDLGADADGVVTGLSATLGGTVSDTFADYPVADGLGQYTTTEGDTGYVAPVGRSVCWSIGFCAEFGGAARSAMSFTGWSYHDDTAGTLHTGSGVTLLTRWSDAPSIVADQGGCYSSGSGTADGIRLSLQSSGAPFSSFDAAGNYVLGSPSPADVTVTWMETGEVPVFLYGDC